jgi:hypothetical protein
MSEKITHTIAMDDSFRLMLASEALCPAFTVAAKTCWDIARLGSGTRAGDRHSLVLLTRFRERWSDKTAEDHLEAKLAFVMGWLCHRAADRQMKPIFRSLNPGSAETPTECSVYHDAFLFRERYLRDQERLYTRATFEADLGSLPVAGSLDVSALRELFHTLLQQSLVEIHTLDPDEAHIEAWLDGLVRLQQGFYVDVDRYAQAIAAPDPAKLARYVSDIGFYERTDPVIAAAEALQRGEALASTEVRKAIDRSGKSHYARALGTACRYLASASAYFEREIDIEELRQRLDIGKPGRDGKPV